MKKKHLTLIIAMILLLFSCNNEDDVAIDEGMNKETEIVTFTGNVNTIIDNLQGCRIKSITEEVELSNSSFSLQTLENNCVQTIVVGDESDKAYLLARTPIKKGMHLEVNTQSTALAIVMLHPLFSPLKADDYDDMVKFITSSSNYPAFYNEVDKTIANKQDVLSEDNQALISALGNLLDDLFKNVYNDFGEEDYDGELDPIQSSQAKTRGNYDNPQIYPLSASIYGNKLILQNTNLTPSYYGTVEQADGTSSDVRILACSDWGWWQWLTQGTMRYGEKSEFVFDKEGEYRFKLSRVNEAATIDFYMRLGSCVLSTIGLDTSDKMSGFANYIMNRCTSVIGSLANLNGDATDIPTVLSIVSGAVCDYLTMEASKDLIDKGWWNNVREIGKYAGKALVIYNIIKGSSNIIDRIAYAIAAPKELNFCLCYYNGEISTCTTAKLIKSGGDEQTGYANQKLLLPLKVYVQTLGDNGLYYPSSSYHKVKFEVVSGGGNVSDELTSANDGNVASTDWRLGEQGEQVVKATVVDVITEKEISDPVYFTAKIVDAEVTVRLDWSQHSGRTDIDLHVFDPFGEEIAFYNMNSASGGYLDRDDVVGPGPEHIHWDNAPAGTYKIYVHYYPNGDEDKSVVSYKVSVTANDITYRPVSGFISYNEMIPVGQFTIGTNETRALNNIKIHNINEIKANIMKYKK